MSLSQRIYELLHQEPFAPFRVYLKDGQYYDVRHRWNNVVGADFLAIGIPRPNDPHPWPIAERSVEVWLADVDRVEPLVNREAPAKG